MTKRSTFVKVYDDIGDHPGFIAVSAEGLGLWLQSLTYCHRNSTDGHFPQRAISRWGVASDSESASVLIDEGRWHTAGHACKECPGVAPGYAYVHGYLEVHNSKEQIAELSAKRAQSGKIGGQTRSRKQGAKQAGGTAKQTGGESYLEIEVEVEKNSTTAADAAEFDTWWAAYPKKVGKTAATRAYAKARKEATAQELLDGLSNAVAVWTSEGQDVKYVPHPASWLNAGRWMDEQPSLPTTEAARPATLRQCDGTTCPGGRHTWTDTRNHYLCQGA